MIDTRALAAWNLANAKARRAYRVQEGLEVLPGGLNYRPDGLHGRPIRGWLLDLMADAELAEARAIAAELVAEVALSLLGQAELEIRRLGRRG